VHLRPGGLPRHAAKQIYTIQTLYAKNYPDMKKKKSTQAAETHKKTGGGISKAGANHLLSIALLVLLCVIVYYNSLSNGFVYDDFGSIVENKCIQQPDRFLASLFNRSYFQIAGLEASYNPVATLSYFLSYSIAELNPFYYHLTSLVMHALNAILVYWLANYILQQRLRAPIAGMLLVCHPALSEAVNCIDFNEDLLAAFFFLLAFISYTRISTEWSLPSIRDYALALLFYFLGLLSKEMAITLPAGFCLVIQHFAKVTDLDPENTEAHYHLGVAHAMQGNLKQAISAWEKVLQLDPDHRSATNNLPKAKAMMKKSD
jgi:hypothetical protein